MTKQRIKNVLSRGINRIRTDGVLMAINLTLKHLFGLNLINAYNAVVFREYKIITSCDISTPLPRATQLPHPVGIVIGHDVDVGSNVCIRQNVTIGRRKPNPEEGYPKINDGVVVGAGSVILGDITLHERCVIGANSVVLEDVNANSTVAGVPATERQ